MIFLTMVWQKKPTKRGGDRALIERFVDRQFARATKTGFSK